MTDIPLHFDWVRARGDCSVPTVFKELELGVRSDVEAVRSLLVPGSQVKFSVATGPKRFSVVRVDDPVTLSEESINFVLTSNAITVHGDDGGVTYTASVTLNDKGECKLLVEGNELDQWQFRRRTLEKLFFGPRTPLR